MKPLFDGVNFRESKSLGYKQRIAVSSEKKLEKCLGLKPASLDTLGHVEPYLSG